MGNQPENQQYQKSAGTDPNQKNKQNDMKNKDQNNKNGGFDSNRTGGSDTQRK